MIKIRQQIKVNLTRAMPSATNTMKFDSKFTPTGKSDDWKELIINFRVIYIITKFIS